MPQLINAPNDDLPNARVNYVRAAATTNVVLASAVENGDSFGGVTLATGNRVGLFGQTAGAENGVYTVNASGAPTRATDFNTAAEFPWGLLIGVKEGTYAGQFFLHTTLTQPPTLGTTALTFAGPFSAADLAAHLADTSDAHDASAVSYAGGTGMAATDVEAAIDELATEKANLADPSFTGFLELAEIAAPATPGAAKVRLYAKSDGSLYQKDDAGSETGLAGGGGGGASTDPLDIAVYNDSGSTITKGTPVWFTGGNTGGVPEVEPAHDDSITGFVGLVVADIATGAAGTARRYGVLTGLDTSALSLGAAYLGNSAGTLTDSPAGPPNGYYLVVGQVTVVHASTGEILVDPAIESPWAHGHASARDGGLLSDPSFSGLVDITEAIRLRGDISPAQITADQHDYAPSGFATATVLRLSTDASRTITGLAGGGDGRVVVLVNVGGFNLVLADDSASSTAANRFALDAALTLAPDMAATLIYDATSSRWRLVGVGRAADATGGGGGSVATDAIFDAKGDLAVGTGADTAARLAVGANDRILMADSGEATGLKWAASQTPSTQAFGDAAAEGTADTYARGDHLHAMPADPVPAHTGDTTDAHDASAVSYDPTASGLTATDVQDAIDELDTVIGGLAGGHTEDHDHDGSPTQKLAQANTHESPDTDTGTGSLHHTIGAGANQAAAGDHTHAGGGLYSAYVLVKDQKTAGTEGGSFTSGAWRTRDLTTEVVDSGNHASLSSNQVTLAAGTWDFRITCPAFDVDSHQARLQNVTDATTAATGTSEFTSSANNPSNSSLIVGSVTIAGAKAFEVQHRCQTTRASNGFGAAANTAFTVDAETYTVAEFFKRA
jgi:hypothetical protein